MRSAGTQLRAIHALTLQVMQEVGIACAYQFAKGLDALDGIQPELAITVCDIAREACAHWGAAVLQLHWSIADPRAVSDKIRQQPAA